MNHDETVGLLSEPRTAHISWVGDCDRCGCSEVMVKTLSPTDDYLYADEEITCPDCGLKGIVEVDGYNDENPCAYASWDEFDESAGW